MIIKILYRNLDFIIQGVCYCGCGGEIEIQEHHKWYGIPKYIKGHSNRGIPKSEETKRKLSESHMGQVAWNKGIGNTPQDFWNNVNIKEKDDCWEWMGYLDHNGYGSISINNYPNRTHRYAWEIVHGCIPEGLCICHKCDNPKCCNPEHLFMGTVYDNTHDMIKKGRKVVLRGESNWFSKLTEKDVLEIRKLYSTGKYNQHKLGKMFNVTNSNIECIVNRKSWKHLS